METTIKPKVLTLDFVDPRDFETFDKALSKLQGNILKGHGRNNTMHILLRFTAGKQHDVTKWLKHFVDDNITTFKKQLKEREAFKRNGVNGDTFCSILFTKEGYMYFNKDTTPLVDKAFTDSMRNRTDNPLNENLNDWENNFKTDWHIMILLADNDEIRMGNFAKGFISTITDEDNVWQNSLVETSGSVNSHDIKVTGLHIEYGHAIRNANGDGLEHNGYVDGISQPLFLKDEQDDYMAFHGITDWQNAKFNPTAKPGLVLLPDPFVTDEEDAFGSYFVFRKLEQNVQAFKTAEKNLGLGERGGASIVGRYEDGTPLTVSKNDGMIGSGNFNNFDYQHNKSHDTNHDTGNKCPYLAHIRKVNPREIVGGEDPKPHTMARRGIPFGKRDVDTVIDPSIAQMPTGGVGLLFMSYQKSIENQFEFIQKNWANSKTFPAPTTPHFHTTGIDPIIGQENTPRDPYSFPVNWHGNHLTPPLDFGQFVTMRGGEYFFAPSIPFFKTL